MNILIKLSCLVGLAIAPILGQHGNGNTGLPTQQQGMYAPDQQMMQQQMQMRMDAQHQTMQQPGQMQMPSTTSPSTQPGQLMPSTTAPAAGSNAPAQSVQQSQPTLPDDAVRNQKPGTTAQPQNQNKQ